MRHTLLFLSLALACAPPPVAEPALDPELVKREVLAVADSILSGYRANDAEAIRRHFDEHADYISAGDGVYGIDAQADAQSLRALFAGGDHHRYLAFEDVDRRVAVLAPEVAVFNNRYRETLQFKSGDTVSIRGTYTLVFVRRGGSWKVLQQYFGHCLAADTVSCTRP